MTVHGSDDQNVRPESEGSDTRTLALLRKIESGEVEPKCVSASDRRRLVAFLIGDGYSTAEIAQILQVADRTVERDKKAIREANAITREPQLVGQMVGRLMGEAELSVQHIRKAVRDKTVSPAVKVDAEQRCYQIISDLVQSMQRLGYLPTAAQKVEADLTHHVGEVPDFDVMHAEVRRVRQICQNSGGEVPADVALLERQIVQADLATRVEDLAGQHDQAGEMGDDSE